MKIIKILKIPNSFEHNLPNNILKHCQHERKQKASLFVWFCLSKYVNLKNIRFTKNNKPYLLDKSKYISLSHSSNMVAFAISDVPIGIDIEKFVSTKIASSLSKRLLDKNQLKAFDNAKDKCLWFTRYWTKLEAMMKIFDNSQTLSRHTYTTVSRIVKDSTKQKYVMSYVYINKKRA